MILAERGELLVGKSASMAGAERKPFVHVECPSALCRILLPDIALVIWQRNLADDLGSELAGLALDEVDDILFRSEPGELGEALADAMRNAGYPDMPALRRDIVMLASRHSGIMGHCDVRIRLEVVETDACRKFHADYITVRTLATYLGQGTQWIEGPCADMAGRPGGPEIRQCDTGAVAMFKGRLWQEDPAILHRSPPIGRSGEQRLVLAIDPASAEDDALWMSA